MAEAVYAALPPVFRAQFDRLHIILHSAQARQFLPQYTAGFDIVVWIDADCWVQTEDAILTMARVAADGAIALTSELDVFYQKLYFHRWAEKMAIWYKGRFWPDGGDRAVASAIAQHRRVRTSPRRAALDTLGGCA